MKNNSFVGRPKEMALDYVWEFGGEGKGEL